MASDGRQSLDAPPVSRVKSSASVASAFNYPHGHLNALSDQQEDALLKFKALLEKRGVWKRGPPPSHNDQTLLYVGQNYKPKQGRATDVQQPKLTPSKIQSLPPCPTLDRRGRIHAVQGD